MLADRYSFMGDSGGHVEDVAGLENPVLAGFETGEQAQILVRQKRAGRSQCAPIRQRRLPSPWTRNTSY